MLWRINRDKNVCFNIKKLFDTYMTLGKNLNFIEEVLI